MDVRAAEFRSIVETLKRASAILRESDVTYCLGGSVASWARGGPETVNDLDYILAPEDVEQAVAAFEAAGFRSERPPEGWLVKVWDDDQLVDLIFEVTGYDDVHDILEDAEVMRVASLDVPVARVEDVLTPKLLAFDEHYLDYTGALRAARALREQIDWAELRRRTQHSPYARGFLHLLVELEVAPPEAAGETAPAGPASPGVRAVPG